MRVGSEVPASRSEAVAPGEDPGRPGRLVGLDVARCLALLGMIATHVVDERTVDGDLTTLQWLAGGRAAALFAVLAGVSLALVSGRREPLHGASRSRRSVGLALRAALIALVGLFLGDLQSGIAIILTYYGVLFLAGLPFLGLRTRSLAVLATVWVVAGPVLNHLVRPHLSMRGDAVPKLEHLADPVQLLSDLLFTGWYPVLPWLAYLFVGMALGRANLRDPRLLGALAVGGAALTVGTTVLSRFLTSQTDVIRALMSDEPSYPTGEALLDDIAEGMSGTTPTGGEWEWLLVVAPHSATPFDLAQTIGSALAVIGGSLLLLRWLPPASRRVVAVLFGAGAMTFTLYTLHVVMRSPWVWPEEEPETFVWHVLVVLWIGAMFAAVRRRGPLEWIASKLTHV